MDNADNGMTDTRRVIEMIVLVALVLTFVLVSWFIHKPLEEGNFNREMIGIIIAAGLTLIMYSFLYRDNPLFKIAENLYVGVALGYGAIIVWRQSLRTEVFEPLFLAPTSDAFWNALAERGIPILLGLLLLTRLSRKHSWLSRYSYGPLVGWFSGMTIVTTVHTMILKQLKAAIVPLQQSVADGLVDLTVGQWIGEVAMPILGSVVLLAGTVSVLFYFFFSVEHKRFGTVVAKTGIWFLMISFGATYGYTVMGRLSLLIDRVAFLLFDWLKLSQ